MTDDKQTNDSLLHIRVPAQVREEFLSKCSGMGRTYSDLIREFVVAFNEGRLTIKDNAKRGLYK